MTRNLSDFVHVGPWDLVLVAVVSLQATIVAYVATPRVKSIFLTLPFPEESLRKILWDNCARLYGLA